MISSDTAAQGLVGFGRVATAVLVTYVFMVLLMTVSAQQSVDAQLKAKGATYSSAVSDLRDANELRKQLKAAADEIARHISARDEAQRAMSESARLYVPARQEFAELAPTIGGADCPISDDGNLNSLAPWHKARGCLDTGRLEASGAIRFKALLDRRPNLEDLEKRWRDADERLGAAQKLVDNDAAEKQAQADIQARADAVRTIFAELDVFRNNWWLLGWATTGFAPALLQILLALASGAFGALLITLVFIVYPKNALTVTQGQGFGARILLGGLISVCTYIVLGGGSAILGATNAFGQGQTNFMTFCAVGVLAGMFSDRVAAWLSKRADLVFDDAAGKGGETKTETEKSAEKTKKE